MLWIGKILLIAVAGQGVFDRANAAVRQAVAIEAVNRYGGFVHYDYEWDGQTLTPGREPTTPVWLRKTLGDDFFHDVIEVNLVDGESPDGRSVRVNAVSDEIIPQLVAFPHLKRLFLQKTQATDATMDVVADLSELETLMMFHPKVTDVGIGKLKGLKRLETLHASFAGLGDDGLKHLSGFPKLRTISMPGNRFSDKGLAYLKDMTNLKHLTIDCNETDVTDAGMSHLKALTNIEVLGLQKTKVTDAGLKHLEGMKKLKELAISPDFITNGGVVRLLDTLPNLKIHTIP